MVHNKLFILLIGCLFMGQRMLLNIMFYIFSIDAIIFYPTNIFFLPLFGIKHNIISLINMKQNHQNRYFYMKKKRPIKICRFIMSMFQSILSRIHKKKISLLISF